MRARILGGRKVGSSSVKTSWKWRLGEAPRAAMSSLKTLGFDSKGMKALL